MNNIGNHNGQRIGVQGGNQGPNRRSRRLSPLEFFLQKRLGTAIVLDIVLWMFLTSKIVGWDTPSIYDVIIFYPFWAPLLVLTFPRRRSELFGVLKLLGVALWECLRFIVGLKSYNLMDTPSRDSDGTWHEYRIYHNVWSAWLYSRIASKGRKPVHHPPHCPGERFHFHTFDHSLVQTERGLTNIHFSYGDPVHDENEFELVANEGGEEGGARYRYKNQTNSWKWMPRLLFDL